MTDTLEQKPPRTFGQRLFLLLYNLFAIVAGAALVVVVTVVSIVSAVIGLIVCLIADINVLWGVPASVLLGLGLTWFVAMLDSGDVTSGGSRRKSRSQTPD